MTFQTGLMNREATITVHLTEPEKYKLRQRAAIQGKTLSTYIYSILTELLDEKA